MITRVTQADIDELLNQAETQSHVFWDKTLVVSYKLPSGFTIQGTSSCVDSENFNMELGLAIARADAEKQLWRLEGYRKQLELNLLSLNQRGQSPSQDIAQDL